MTYKAQVDAQLSRVLEHLDIISRCYGDHLAKDAPSLFLQMNGIADDIRTHLDGPTPEPIPIPIA